jgi:integrase
LSLSLSDLRAMLATCDRRTFIGDRDRALLLALLNTGCRVSEFIALNVQDVNTTAGAVIIRSGKGGKFRTAGSVTLLETQDRRRAVVGGDGRGTPDLWRIAPSRKTPGSCR